MHFLIVEDVPADFELIEYELQRAGLTFSSARVDTHEELSCELDRQPPQLILCDHGNARIDSFSVLAVVRARSPALPFIVVTGSLPEAQVADAFARGADDLVLKHRLEELGPAVKRALRLGEARQRLAEVEQERDRLRAELEAWKFGRPRSPAPLPICAGCKKIRTQSNDWIQMESYLLDHFNIRFSHGLCEVCVETYSMG